MGLLLVYEIYDLFRLFKIERLYKSKKKKIDLNIALINIMRGVFNELCQVVI